MLTLATAAVIRALLSIGGGLLGQQFLEDVMRRVLIWALPRLAAMTTNTIDDELAAAVVKALQKQQTEQ